MIGSGVSQWREAPGKSLISMFSLWRASPIFRSFPPAFPGGFSREIGKKKKNPDGIAAAVSRVLSSVSPGSQTIFTSLTASTRLLKLLSCGKC